MRMSLRRSWIEGLGGDRGDSGWSVGSEPFDSCAHMYSVFLCLVLVSWDERARGKSETNGLSKTRSLRLVGMVFSDHHLASSSRPCDRSWNLPC